jgi:hypothetical protein
MGRATDDGFGLPLAHLNSRGRRMQQSQLWYVRAQALKRFAIMALYWRVLF